MLQTKFKKSSRAKVIRLKVTAFQHVFATWYLGPSANISPSKNFSAKFFPLKILMQNFNAKFFPSQKKI